MQTGLKAVDSLVDRFLQEAPSPIQTNLDREGVERDGLHNWRERWRTLFFILFIILTFPNFIIHAEAEGIEGIASIFSSGEMSSSDSDIEVKGIH